eukprot:2190467-Amphidinium_carterae.1
MPGSGAAYLTGSPWPNPGTPAPESPKGEVSRRAGMTSTTGSSPVSGFRASWQRPIAAMRGGE